MLPIDFGLNVICWIACVLLIISRLEEEVRCKTEQNKRLAGENRQLQLQITKLKEKYVQLSVFRYKQYGIGPTEYS